MAKNRRIKAVKKSNRRKVQKVYRSEIGEKQERRILARNSPNSLEKSTRWTNT